MLEPAAYQTWLAGGSEGSLADRGAALFQQLACNTCHLDSGQGRGPSLNDIWGTPVELSDGSTVIVDEVYVRESILNSQAKVVRGFQPLMPTFQGLISEEGLVSLIEYIRSLSQTAARGATWGRHRVRKVRRVRLVGAQRAAGGHERNRERTGRASWTQHARFRHCII